MKLQNITLSNFKGLAETTFSFGGRSALIQGANGAGKSRTMDAYSWLLTGQDSSGAANFDIKPTKEDGNGNLVIDRGETGDRQIECSVQAEFERPDGSKFTLKRALKENWVTPTGETQKEYRGDKTDYFIDGVPHKLKDYSDFVAKEFAAENLIRLVSIPGHFNDGIDKALDRRAILFDTFGDMTDDEVIKSVPDLAPLESRLEGRTVDGLKEMMTYRRKEAIAENDGLPIRIDEATKSLVEGADSEKAEREITKLDEQLQQLNGELLSLDRENPKETLKASLTAKQKELERETTSYNNYCDDKANELTRAHRLAVQAAEDELRAKEAELTSTTRKLEQITAELSRLSAVRKQHLADWKTANAEVFSADTTCPTCKQEFPKEYLEELEGNWNEAKAEKLSGITAKGKVVATDIEWLEREKATIEADITKAQAGINETAAKLKSEKGNEPKFEPEKAIADEYLAKAKKLKGEIQKLEESLNSTEDSSNPEKTELKERIDFIKFKRAEQQKIIAQAENNAQIKSRIAEYAQRQKEIREILDDTKQVLDLCDKFSRSKAAIISDNINKHFEIVKFQLFEELKNGGTREVCEATALGKSYSGRGMNKALRVAANLDISVTFSKALDLNIPIFLDDVEGAFDRYGVDTGDRQVITLLAVDESPLEVIIND